MKREKPDLQPEGQYEESHRIIAPWRRRQRSDSVADKQATAWNSRRQKHEGHQEESFTENGQAHVDSSRALCLRSAVKCDEAIGRKTCEREKEIEARQIVGQESAEIAGQGHQPPDGEASGIWLVPQIVAGISTGSDPQQRSNPDQHGAWPVEDQCQSKQRLRKNDGRAVSFKTCGCKG